MLVGNSSVSNKVLIFNTLTQNKARIHSLCRAPGVYSPLGEDGLSFSAALLHTFARAIWISMVSLWSILSSYKDYRR